MRTFDKEQYTSRPVHQSPGGGWRQSQRLLQGSPTHLRREKTLAARALLLNGAAAQPTSTALREPHSRQP